MKAPMWCAALMAGVTTLTACGHPVQRVEAPNPQDPRSYAPVVQPKPLPPEVTGIPPANQVAQAGVPGAAAIPAAAASGAPAGLDPTQAAQAASAANAMAGEEAYVAAYQNRRSPRMMVFVNRTLQGDAVPKAELDTMISEGRVINVTRQDEIAASRSDYEMIELSIIDYLDAGGRVTIKDSDMVRAKMDREKVLRIENGDPAAIRLLNTELQTDVLIQVKATPTRHAQWPQGAVRLLAKAMSTTDGRILATAFVDMPLPMSKTNINVFTRYLSEKMMAKMTAVWAGNPIWDPIEMRIYKAAGVDDTLTIRKFMLKLPGVQRVVTQGATGGTSSGYAVLSVAYNGAPEDLYAELKDDLKASTGLKAVDVSGNTINVEITGPMNLVTTTRTTEIKTTVETTTNETKTIEPIRPATPETPAPGVVPPVPSTEAVPAASTLPASTLPPPALPTTTTEAQPQ